MAIFQPTNIIPSSFTQGTVDVNQNMEISWQVNGNSAMTAFQIDFYLNDTASTPVYSTGRKTDNCPFYGTDRFGRPQFFTYNAGKSWAQASMLETNPFTNGNNYKFKITQFFAAPADEIYTASPSGSLSGQRALYLRINSTTVNKYVVFDFQEQTYTSGVIYYNWTKQKGWIITSNKIVPISTTVVDSEPPYSPFGTSTLVPVDSREDFLTQYDFANFITRDTPTLELKISDNENYANPIALSDTLATSIGYFVAKYEQEEGDSIRWIRWQIATANNSVVGDILADTGDIYTPTLNFEFNGFFNGNQYAIRCFGESESGQATQLQGANTEGWIFFNISYAESTYTGSFTAQCLHKENATLLEWEGVTVIPYAVSPEDYKPTVSNGSVTLLPKNSETGEEYSVTWDKVWTGDSLENMNFSTPWTAVWKGNCAQSINQITPTYVGNIDVDAQTSHYITDIAFSPNGTLCVVGASAGTAYLYRVTDTSFEYASEIKKMGGSLYSGTDFIRFSPDGSVLLIGSNNYGIQIFSVSGETVTYIGDLKYNNSNIRCSDAVFNSSGDRLIVIGATNDLILLYTTSGTTFTFSKIIYSIKNDASGGTEAISNLALSPEDSLLIGYGNNIYSSPRHTAIYFSISGDTYTYIGALEDSKGISLGNGETAVSSVSFSPDGKFLAICGSFEEAFNLYSIVDEQISFVKTLTKSGSSFTPTLTNCEFSQNGKALIYGGDQQLGSLELFLVNTSDISYSQSFGNYSIQTLFSPDSKILISVLPDQESFDEYSLTYTSALPQSGKFLTLGADIAGTFDINSINIDFNTNSVSFDIPSISQELLLFITPTEVTATFYDSTNAVISQTTSQFAYTQQPITSVSIYGGDSGTTVDSVSIYQGDGSNVLPLYQKDANFEPIWNSDEYDLYMTANFNGNLEGGTGTSSGKGFQIYRQEVGKNVLTPIANVKSTVTSLKDYGISSRKAYEYLLGVYDSNNAFMGLVTAQNTIATCFKNYSLLVCDYDEAKDEYHVRKQYLFALNLSTGSVGNNNSPTLNANFTQYPTRMPSTQNYASGTLSGLIGAIYTVPALIEQIGQYKYTAKLSTMDYFDSVDLEKELYDLSTAPYQLFLRDMKGRLRMIATNGAISMTTNIKQKQQSISISFPWVEVGDASDVTIIQTPDDYGWNNDNQVLDVQLDVDVETGELSATYPFPYNGTKFYLTGVNKENLTAKTPIEVTPAQFNLSDTATQTTDGEVTATVTVNSEVDK